MMRQRFRSALTGLRYGGFFGAIAGAIAFSLIAYFDDTAYIIGYARNWMGVYMVLGLVVGGIFGAVVGAIFGAVIGAIQANHRTGK